MSTLSLEKLLKQKQQLEARIKSLTTLAAQKSRKEDTRRKILAGAYILHKHERENTLESFLQELNDFLVRPKDKALFKLPFNADSNNPQSTLNQGNSQCSLSL